MLRKTLFERYINVSMDTVVNTDVGLNGGIVVVARVSLDEAALNDREIVTSDVYLQV